MHRTGWTLALVLIASGSILASNGSAAGAADAPPAPAPVAPAVSTPVAIPSAPSAPSTGPIPTTTGTGASSPYPFPSPTAPTGRRLAAFSVDAKTVAFYSNRFIIGADGNVRVTLGDGTQIRGNTFEMDLRLNRFVIAGDVKLFSHGVETDGAAFSEFFDFDRAYFLPLTTEPDRWTYAAGDYAHPLLGREMPGDVFALPDLDGERVFLYAKRAVTEPHESVRFTPSKVNFGLTFVTFPTFYLNFSQNPNFAQNALSGAVVDGPYDFAGGDHALATAHLRYDSVNKAFFAYEQHQVSKNHYFVFSVNPLTRPGKQYNFLAFDRISPALQFQASYQEFTFQHGFSQPLTASAFVNLQLTAALHHSFLQLTTVSYYQSLLAQPKGPVHDLYYGDYTHPWIPDHPDGASLVWTGFRNKIADLPLSFQLRSSTGFNHNGISVLDENSGLEKLGGVEYTTIYNHAVGGTLLTAPIIVLPDKTGRKRDVYFTGVFDKQRTWYSVPHHIDVTTATLSLTKPIDPQHLVGLLSYTNTNISDFYGAQQSAVYPSVTAISPVTDIAFPAYRAFRGFSTSRSFNQQLVFTPNPAFNASLTMRENDDFPVAIPGNSQTVGNITFFNNYGVPPYQLTLDARYRFNSLLTLDVSRSYYFNFGGYQRWTPMFLVPGDQMTNRLRGILCIASLAAVVALESGVPPADSAAIPPPTTAVTGDTPPPLDATATPKPEGTLLRYTGQILDERKGYVFFTTGDAYRLAPDVKIDDAKSGGVTALLPETRTFARATFDGATGQVIELGLSPKRLPDEATYDQVKGFAVALSTPYANPDLRPVGGFNGKPVLVVFTVEVPPDTPFSDTVYLATDASGWSATAIKMDRIDALHYRVARNLASGTKLLFRYTLGSWQSAERGQDGLEVTPRVLTVHNSDVQTEKDIVYHWGGSNQFDPGNDQSIPTPFNPIPFNTPPHR